MTERRSNADHWYAVMASEHGDDDSASARAGFRLALTQAAGGELHTAAQMLSRVYTGGDYDLAPRAALELMLLLRQLRDDDGAQQVLAQADLLADPKFHYDVKINVGLAWQQFGELDRAANAYRAVLAALTTGADRPLLGDGERTAVALAAYRLGQLALRRNELGEAERLWRHALAAGDEDVSPHAALDLAEMLNKELFPAEAEELLRLAIDYDHPDVSPRATLALARFLRNRWQMRQAEDLFRAVVRSKHPEVGEVAAGELRQLRHDAVRRSVRQRQVALPLRSDQLELIPSARAKQTRVIVVGAGTGGQYLVQSMKGRPFEVVGFIDDDAERLAEADDLRMLGTVDQVAQILTQVEVDEVHMAIPTAPGRVRAKVVDACRSAGVRLRNLPTMYELLNNRPLVNQLRPVRIEETIGDQPAFVDREAVTWLRGKSVLVTGAAGSLGSELSRRLAQARVKHLVMVDRDQPSLQAINDELTEQREFEACFPILADCGDQSRMDAIMHLYETQVLFHAASYADAAFVETNPIEAATNGPVALSRLLRAAGQRKINKFVYVSSWHADRCSSLFGATKALSERAVTAAASEYTQTVFLSVRVGDVFRDRTSLIDTWERQIAFGGPIKTFECGRRVRVMTNHRAVELLLHAARVGESGEILGTNAGETVNLRELAHRFLELWGKQPDHDVAVTQRGADRVTWPSVADGCSRTAPHPDHPELVRVQTEPAEVSPKSVVSAIREATSRREAATVEQLLRGNGLPVLTARIH